jgi:hypothetical protein
MVMPIAINSNQVEAETKNSEYCLSSWTSRCRASSQLLKANSCTTTTALAHKRGQDRQYGASCAAVVDVDEHDTGGATTNWLHRVSYVSRAVSRSYSWQPLLSPLLSEADEGDCDRQVDSSKGLQRRCATNPSKIPKVHRKM